VQIQNLATQIYSNVDFVWMLNGGTTLSMGWTPETRFLPFVGILQRADDAISPGNRLADARDSRINLGGMVASDIHVSG